MKSGLPAGSARGQKRVLLVLLDGEGGWGLGRRDGNIPGCPTDRGWIGLGWGEMRGIKKVFFGWLEIVERRGLMAQLRADSGGIGDGVYLGWRESDL